METIEKGRRTSAVSKKLPQLQNEQSCDFNGYDADVLMKETAKCAYLKSMPLQ
jgi:hypothetical protein